MTEQSKHQNHKHSDAVELRKEVVQHFKALAAPNPPLGHVTSKELLSHSADAYPYIRPVPPTYVTEYEDKFKWPDVYEQKDPALTLPLQRMSHHPTVPLKHVKRDHKGHAWAQAERDVDLILANNGDCGLTGLQKQELQRAVHQHKLDASIEDLYGKSIRQASPPTTSTPSFANAKCDDIRADLIRTIQEIKRT